MATKPQDNALPQMKLDLRAFTLESTSLKGDDPLRHYLRLGSDLHGNTLDWPELTVGRLAVPFEVAAPDVDEDRKSVV